MFRHVCRMGGGHRVEVDGCALSQRTVKVAQVEEPGERGGTPGARGGVILVLTPTHHAQMENRTLTIKAALKMSVAIPATSMMEARLG